MELYKITTDGYGHMWLVDLQTDREYDLCVPTDRELTNQDVADGIRRALDSADADMLQAYAD